MPQDVEWAVAAGRLLLLQARPITNLPPEPVALADAERPILYYPERVREMMPGPLSPFTETSPRRRAPAVQDNLVHHKLMPALGGRPLRFTNAVIGRPHLHGPGRAPPRHVCPASTRWPWWTCWSTAAASSARAAALALVRSGPGALRAVRGARAWSAGWTAWRGGVPQLDT